jgi:hypothetical protein
MATIDNEVQTTMDAFRNNPNALMQKFQQNQQFIDLLALQKLKSEKEAAARDVKLSMQNNPNTIKAQREQEVLAMTKDDVAKQMSGILAVNKARQQNNVQKVANRGVPNRGIAGQPAPNMQTLAGGGIIGFQNRGQVKSYDQALQEMLKEKGLSYREYINQEVEKVKNDPSLDNDAKRERISQLQSGTYKTWDGPRKDGRIDRLYGKSVAGTWNPFLPAKNIASQVGDTDQSQMFDKDKAQISALGEKDFQSAVNKPEVSAVDAYEAGVSTPPSYQGSQVQGMGLEDVGPQGLSGFKKQPPPEDKTGLKNLLMNKKFTKEDFNVGDIKFSGIAKNIEDRVKKLKGTEDYKLKDVDKLEKDARKDYLESDLIQKILPGMEEKAKTEEAGLQKLIDSKEALYSDLQDPDRLQRNKLYNFLAGAAGQGTFGTTGAAGVRGMLKAEAAADTFKVKGFNDVFGEKKDLINKIGKNKVDILQAGKDLTDKAFEEGGKKADRVTKENVQKLANIKDLDKSVLDAMQGDQKLYYTVNIANKTREQQAIITSSKLNVNMADTAVKAQVATLNYELGMEKLRILEAGNKLKAAGASAKNKQTFMKDMLELEKKTTVKYEEIYGKQIEAAQLQNNKEEVERLRALKNSHIRSSTNELKAITAKYLAEFFNFDTDKKKKDDDKENAEPTAQNKTDKVSSILAGLNNPKRITTGYKSSAPGNFAEQQKRLKEAEQKRLAGIS